MPKILLVDGMNLVFRSFYALPKLTNRQQVSTGALYGFIKTIWKLEDIEKPDTLAIFFDSKEPTRHHALHPEYKAQRSATPEALISQIPILIEILKAIGIPTIRQPTIEADDLIASAASQKSAQQYQSVIVSSDKDFAQCLHDPSITLLLPPSTTKPSLGWRHLRPADIIQKYGIPPIYIPDYLALIGDTSDNIQGVQGIGPKTATKWIQGYGGIDNILQHLDHLQPQRLAQKLKNSTDILKRNLQLVTLETHHPISPLTTQPLQIESLTSILQEMDMQKILEQTLERYSNTPAQSEFDL